MATKGTNSKIKELKGIKPEKITAEQLEKVQEVVNAINRGKMELGSIEMQKHTLLHQLNSAQESLGVLQKELEKDYGTVDVNIQTGEINYDVEADTKD